MRETPDRFVKVLEYNASGCFEDPAAVLTKVFAIGTYDEMVHVREIRVCTACAHHGERILGKAHIAYIPKDHVVGLSKPARMIDILCRRPQIQENLSEQVVDIFQRTVQPYGCAVHLRAYHCCMIARGVWEPAAITETVALRGCFKDNPATRLEFLSSLDHSATTVWP